MYNQEYQKVMFQDNSQKTAEKQKYQRATPKTRDLKKWLKSGRSLRILAIEHQSKINYIMPWRHMYYDALEYGKQIGELSSTNKREKLLSTDEEFLSGLKEEDRLIPAFTACLYLGTDPWTGPRNLSDMMDFGEDEEGWKDFFSDYQMNLICVNEIKDFSVFHTQLKLLLMLLAYREDKEKMKREIENNPEFAEIDRETAYVANVLLGHELFVEEYIEEEGNEVNMCGALRGLIEDGREEGRELLGGLILKLLADNRAGDLERAATDREYQDQLLQEYGLV